MNDLIAMNLDEMFRAAPAVEKRLPALRKEVRAGRTTPLAATHELMRLFRPPVE